MQDLAEKSCKFNSWLWKKNNKSKLPEKLLRGIFQIILAIVADVKQGQLSLRAMSLVYTTIISLVPLFAISFSVLKGLGAHNQIKPFLLNALDALGEKKFEITEKILGFVDNIQVGVLGAVGIAVLLYTVIGMMQKIENSFNYVWHVSKARSLGKRINDYLSVLFIGPVLIFVSAAMTASARSNYIIDKLGNIPGFDLLLTLVGFVIPYIILSIAFTFIYAFIPNTKVSIKAAFIGGLTTAFIWKIMGWGFASFVADSGNHAAIYSAFATIIVFMVWIYLVWLVLLIGASIGFYAQYPDYRKIRHNVISLSSEYKEAMAIQIMSEIAKRFDKHEKPVNTDGLSKLCDQPQKIIDEVAGYLKEANLLLIEEETHAWLLAMPIEHISAYDIISSVRKHEGKVQPIIECQTANKYLKEIDGIFQKSFKDKTLKQMISS